MSEDRSVHTDALKTLGAIIDDKQGRDAIHIAVEPVVAGEDLSPGQHVGFRSDGSVGFAAEHIGIVDPFLTQTISKGERFWLLVYPRTITSLRHVWEHPSFISKPAAVASQAEAEIRDICVDLGCTYDELMRHTEYWLRDDDYWCDGDRWEGKVLPTKFWGYYEQMTGRKVSDDKAHSFFSCYC